MNSRKFKKRIGDLISLNKISQAINEMSHVMNNSPHLKELILNSARYNSVKERIRSNTIQPEEAERIKMQIMSALLEMAEEVEQFSQNSSTVEQEIEIAAAHLANLGQGKTQIHYGHGDIIGRDKNEFHEVKDSAINIGANASNELDRGDLIASLQKVFTDIHLYLDNRPEDESIDKDELEEKVVRIQRELLKKEAVSLPKLNRWISELNILAPDILALLKQGVSALPLPMVEKIKF